MNRSVVSQPVHGPFAARPESLPTVRRLGLWACLPYFAVSALLSVLAMHGVTPVLVGRGILPFYAQFIPNGVVLALLLIAAMAGYRREGQRLTWVGIKDRFRLGRLTGRARLWAVGGTVAMFIGFSGASMLSDWLIRTGRMPLPARLPTWMDPRVSIPYVERFNQEAGGPQGN